MYKSVNWRSSNLTILSSFDKMVSGALRRRLHHGDVDGKRHEVLDNSDQYDSLNEPLLAQTTNYHSREETLDDKQRREQLHWTFLFSNLIAQWAQLLTNVIFGAGSLIGRFVPFISSGNESTGRLLPPLLSPLQEARLKYLKERLAIPFDGTTMEHQDSLKQLWRLAYPDRELPSLISELWKEMGWQGTDPSTDFRGGGFISLENLIYFAKTYPESFQDMLHKRIGERSEWEYPFAVAGINISFMLVQMLGLQSATPSTPAGIRFLELLSIDDMAFDNLFCIAFEMLDAQWLAKRASYMEFNEVLKSTRTQLERELSLEDISSIKDLPAYSLLRR